jgi:hypothetical protein
MMSDNKDNQVATTSKEIREGDNDVDAEMDEVMNAVDAEMRDTENNLEEEEEEEEEIEVGKGFKNVNFLHNFPPHH